MMTASRVSKKTPLILAILLVFLLVLEHVLGIAHAASGGVMGGSFFSSSDEEDNSGGDWHSQSHYYHHSSTYCVGSSCDTPASSIGDSKSRTDSLYVFLLFLFPVAAFVAFDICRPRSNKIIMLQVAFSGEAQELVKDLDQIAQLADTSTLKGLHYILTESSLALLRHQNHCISGYSHVEQKQGIENLEKHFNLLSLEEREKLDVETLVNVNNLKVKRSIKTANKPDTKLSTTYIVVTILVATEGRFQLPNIKDSESLKLALRSLASIGIKNIKALQVLWTPGDKNDVMFEDELHEKYPLLKPLSDFD